MDDKVEISYLEGDHANDSPPVQKNRHEEGESDCPSTETEVEFKWDVAMILNLSALMCCYFTSTWAQSFPSASISFIAADFPLEVNNAAWVSTAMVIPNCVLSAFQGELSDILGRKSFILVGMIFGIVGTIVSGRAVNLSMVIGGQVLNGCGLTLGFLAIPFVAELVPKNRRPIVQATAGIMAGLAFVLAPIVVGAFVQNDVGGASQGWRAGFYLCAGFYFMTLIIVLLFYHPAPRPGTKGTSMLRLVLKLDWLGIFLAMAGLVLFLLGLQYGGNPYPWTSAIVLGPLIVGAVLLVVFGLYNSLVRKDGVLHHGLFQHRNFAISLGLNFVGGIVLFGGQAYLPQEITNLFTSNALMAGVWNLPFNAMIIISAMVYGVIMTITKEAKWLIFSAYVLLLIGSGLMAVMEPHINYAAWFFPTSLLGIAVGAVSSITLVVVSLCTPNRYIAHAMSLAASVRALGGSIGVVIFEQILIRKEDDILIGMEAQAALGSGLPPNSLEEFLEIGSYGVTPQLSQVPGATQEVVNAFMTARASGLADCYRYIWYSLVAFSAVTVIISLFLKSTKAQMTDQVAAGITRAHHHLGRRH